MGGKQGRRDIGTRDWGLGTRTRKRGIPPFRQKRRKDGATTLLCDELRQCPLGAGQAFGRSFGAFALAFGVDELDVG